ncbi:hypothetical protein ROHU_030172 [Labeo rohita]|uniref:Uncharacterized protein n=1 Tax=Labeo rohita TaxID=84645 RepID=A0A498LVQ9_LABRO|nr:hypothetical protein ROHU_030172 [Labeo rohita]
MRASWWTALWRALAERGGICCAFQRPPLVPQLQSPSPFNPGGTRHLFTFRQMSYFLPPAELHPPTGVDLSCRPTFMPTVSDTGAFQLGKRTSICNDFLSAMTERAGD